MPGETEVHTLGIVAYIVIVITYIVVPRDIYCNRRFQCKTPSIRI